MTKQKKLKLTKLAELFSPGRILIPIGLGLLAVAYFLYQSFDMEEFKKLEWSSKTFLLVFLTLLIYLIRHLSYSWRLRILSLNHFSWKKSIELITLWEFASAISPTSLGGSATALILLAQEKIKGAKIVAIILYSVVLDTLFFLVSFIIFAIVLGPSFIYPGAESFFKGGFVLSFWIVFGFMAAYGFFFYYGLFINSKQISSLLRWVANRRQLKRFKYKLYQTADDISSASTEIKNKNWIYHFKAFLSTAIAWLLKFATLSLLIFAIFPSVQESVYNFFNILARNQAMFAITAFSPTPGSAGVTEAFFGGFFKDYVNSSGSPILALIWRLITYYSYLLAGAIVLPLWIKSIIMKRKM